MHASCHCLVLSEKKCQGAFLCMAVANPTIGRNLLHVGCDGAVSIPLSQSVRFSHAVQVSFVFIYLIIFYNCNYRLANYTI